MSKFSDYKERKLQDPEFRKEYDALESEFDIIQAMIDARKHIGYFKTPYDAFCAYKKEKESYIKEVAKEYYDKGAIGKNVYDALMNYKIEITD
jgi:hypothetical protein